MCFWGFVCLYCLVIVVLLDCLDPAVMIYKMMVHIVDHNGCRYDIMIIIISHISQSLTITGHDVAILGYPAMVISKQIANC